jgi:hypothetical protein
MSLREQRIISLRKSARRFREIATEHETAILAELLEMADEFDRQAEELQHAEALIAPES